MLRTVLIFLLRLRLCFQAMSLRLGFERMRTLQILWIQGQV